MSPQANKEMWRWLTALFAIAALLLAYGVVDLNDRNRTLELKAAGAESEAKRWDANLTEWKQKGCAKRFKKFNRSKPKGE